MKNYTPQILALAGAPEVRPDILHLANLITKNNSLLILGDVSPVSQFTIIYICNKNKFISIMSILISEQYLMTFKIFKKLNLRNTCHIERDQQN